MGSPYDQQPPPKDNSFQLVWHAESNLGCRFKQQRGQMTSTGFNKVDGRGCTHGGMRKVKSIRSATAQRSFQKSKSGIVSPISPMRERSHQKQNSGRRKLRDSRNESKAFRRGLLFAHIISINTDPPASCAWQHHLLVVAGQHCQQLTASRKDSAPALPQASGNTWVNNFACLSPVLFPWSFIGNRGNTHPYYHSHNIGEDMHITRLATSHHERI